MGRYGVPLSAHRRQKGEPEKPKRCEADPDCPNKARSNDVVCENHAFWRQKAKEMVPAK